MNDFFCRPYKPQMSFTGTGLDVSSSGGSLGGKTASLTFCENETVPLEFQFHHRYRLGGDIKGWQFGRVDQFADALNQGSVPRNFQLFDKQMREVVLGLLKTVTWVARSAIISTIPPTEENRFSTPVGRLGGSRIA